MNDFLSDIHAFEAKQMLRQLQDSPMQVVLMPAPEPKHEGHCVRVVISRPPDWYMRNFYSKRGRKTMKRARLIQALKRIVAKKPIVGRYQSEVIAYLEGVKA